MTPALTITACVIGYLIVGIGFAVALYDPRDPHDPHDSEKTGEPLLTTLFWPLVAVVGILFFGIGGLIEALEWVVARLARKLRRRTVRQHARRLP